MKKSVFVFLVSIIIFMSVFFVFSGLRKNKTLTPTVTSTPTVTLTSAPMKDETENIKSEIKTQLVAKHGQNAEKLNVSVSKTEGNYAQGGAGEIGMGGGMWFAAKEGENWMLVWDGNGIITCDTLTDFPDFPSSMIPQCFDSAKNEMVVR